MATYSVSQQAATKKVLETFIKQYKKAIIKYLPKSSSIDQFFSKMIINTEMYKEITQNMEIRPGYIVTFQGMPMLASDALPYGTIFFVPKIITIDVCARPAGKTIN